jgi:hypothetical protein
MGLDSVVGVATSYRLDGPGINPSGDEIFCTHPDGPGTHPACYTKGTGSFPAVKWPGRGVEHPPTSCTNVK